MDLLANLTTEPIFMVTNLVPWLKKKIFVLPKHFSDISNTITSDLVRQDSSLTVRRIYTTHILWIRCELEILVKQNICKIERNTES